MAALIQRDRAWRVRAAVVLTCLVSTLVSGCSSSQSGDVLGSPVSATPTLQDSTSVIFLSFDRDVVGTTPFITRADARIADSEARVADASGRDPQVFAARDVSIHELWSSAVGSVIAYVTEPGYGDPVRRPPTGQSRHPAGVPPGIGEAGRAIHRRDRLRPDHAPQLSVVVCARRLGQGHEPLHQPRSHTGSRDEGGRPDRRHDLPRLHPGDLASRHHPDALRLAVSKRHADALS